MVPELVRRSLDAPSLREVSRLSGQHADAKPDEQAASGAAAAATASSTASFIAIAGLSEDILPMPPPERLAGARASHVEFRQKCDERNKNDGKTRRSPRAPMQPRSGNDAGLTSAELLPRMMSADRDRMEGEVRMLKAELGMLDPAASVELSS